MSIRWKLLLYFLIIALLPLGFISLFAHRSLYLLGGEFGAGAREELIERAGLQLLRLVDDYGAVMRREAEISELALRVQAREAEHCLAAKPPISPQVFWADDFDRGENPPDGTTLSGKHSRMCEDGKRETLAVNYQQQAFRLAPGVDRQRVAEDVARLSLMLPAYQFVRQGQPELFYWQYTALTSGVHTSYPGHGGYPEDFDPRQRPWFGNALKAGGLTWNPAIVDASTNEAILTVSMPVKHPNGTLAGVTAIDVRLLDVVQGLKVAASWASNTRALVVLRRPRPDRDETGLLIAVQQSYLKEDRNWRVPIRLEWLESDDEAQMRGLIDDAIARRSGLRKMPYQGRYSLWAYAPVGRRDGNLLLIVPYEEITAQAAAAEAAILEQTRKHLQTVTATFIVVTLLVFLISSFSSRSVTRPLAELTDAARKIATGDLRTRASIRSADEVGQLGRAFNEMIPQLADRMRMRESLALAKEVQQHLLPAGPPKIEGLDIAGRSIACDETGGDYYDFLDLAEVSPHLLGVAVGDVTGHGIAAALLMATGRALLRCRADQPGTLAEIISDINRRLFADTDGTRFMTLVFLLIDSPSRTLRWVCAGHDPPITYDLRLQSFGELKGGGIPLGIDAEWKYEEFSGQASPDGQVIVIGTDGIWEARNPAGDMFGKEALRRVIAENAPRSAEEISLAITESLAAFCRARPQEDDITLVVVKVLPQENG